jgi:hypothetical protein
MFITNFNDLFIGKINKNNFRLVRICNANSNGVYDRHIYSVKLINKINRKIKYLIQMKLKPL